MIFYHSNVQVIRLNQKAILSLKHKTLADTFFQEVFFFSLFIFTAAFPKNNCFCVYSKDERNTEGLIE